VLTARLDLRYVGELHHEMPAADSFHVIQVARASDLAVSGGGRSAEPRAEPDEAYKEERTSKAEQNGACNDHIPKLCPTLEPERASPHGEREHTSSAVTRLVQLVSLR